MGENGLLIRICIILQQRIFFTHNKSTLNMFGQYFLPNMYLLSLYCTLCCMLWWTLASLLKYFQRVPGDYETTPDSIQTRLQERYMQYLYGWFISPNYHTGSSIYISHQQEQLFQWTIFPPSQFAAIIFSLGRMWISKMCNNHHHLHWMTHA